MLLKVLDYTVLYLEKDNHTACLLDEDGNMVSYCHWEYVVPINKFNFEDIPSNIPDAL